MFITIGLIAGLVYPLFGDSHENYLPILNGVCTGLIGSVSIALLEIYYFEPHWRTRGFVPTLIAKSIMYVCVLAILVIAVKGFNESQYYKVAFWSYLKGDNFQSFLFKEDFGLILLYSLAIIGFVVFVNQLSRKMGPGVLWNLISGRYHKPKKESIVLLYVDLKSSTRIMEDIGAKNYHHFINRFYRDISGIILTKKGQVYRYVGDQITIFWDEKQGLKNANCVAFYREVKALLEELAYEYEKDFGHRPEFRACCHMGELVVGQLGDVKSQIVFHGEALYICEMIEKKCKDLDEDFLVSEAIWSRIDSDTRMNLEPKGSIDLGVVGDHPVHGIIV